MKTKLISLAIVTLILALVAVSCKKDTSPDSDGTSSTELSAQSDDEVMVSSENDAISNDAELILNTTTYVNGNSVPGICDATFVVDLLSNPRTVTITYNGGSCNGRCTRTGKVIVSMPAGVQWKDAGAAITVTFQNLKITRIRDGRSITLNGTQVHTNVSGGIVANLSSLQTITHTITSDNMSIRFDNNSVRTWHIARKRVFTYSNGIVITITGTHTEGTATGVAEWGTNRFGNTFTCAITQPLVFKQDCSFRLTSGQITHIRPAVTTTTTFGLDASGNPTSCPGSGNYYFRLVWVTSTNTHTVIFPY